MKQEFKNYTIKDGKVILLLEKDIYSRDMINGAGQAVEDECKMAVVNQKDSYEVILRPIKTEGNTENLAILFNDALISGVSLFPN
ncbi:MAG TPA: hypothetical protein VJC37_04360 [Planctomycetota bacterium]|nr:hypothetical protein [Planctomycetota bacterium]